MTTNLSLKEVKLADTSKRNLGGNQFATLILRPGQLMESDTRERKRGVSGQSSKRVHTSVKSLLALFLDLLLPSLVRQQNCCSLRHKSVHQSVEFLSFFMQEPDFGTQGCPLMVEISRCPLYWSAEQSDLSRSSTYSYVYKTPVNPMHLVFRCHRAKHRIALLQLGGIRHC